MNSEFRMRRATLRDENERLKVEAAEVVQLRRELESFRRQSVAARAVTTPAAAVGTNGAAAALEQEKVGTELGMAVVRGEHGAFDKLVTLAKAQFASFRTNTAGLTATELADVSRRTFAGLNAAVKVIEEAAIQDNKFAIDAVMRSLSLSELRAKAAQVLGKLAGNGNEDALEVLLNPDYGVLLSTTVGALQPAADRGNQRAIETLAGVTKDPKHRALWYMAANGLTKAAESGNPTAVGALINLSQTTNSQLRKVVIAGLERAANNRNRQAIETLHSLGLR